MALVPTTTWRPPRVISVDGDAALGAVVTQRAQIVAVPPLPPFLQKADTSDTEHPVMGE